MENKKDKGTFRGQSEDTGDIAVGRHELQGS